MCEEGGRNENAWGYRLGMYVCMRKCGCVGRGSVLNSRISIEVIKRGRKMDRSDLELDGDCRIFYKNKNGVIRDATGTIKGENSDRLFLKNSRLLAVGKWAIVKIEEV